MFRFKCLIQSGILGVLIVGLSGCFVNSPYHGQNFSSRNALIPVQAWSNSKDSNMVLSCHKARISGLYRASIYDWQVVRTMPPQLPGSLDSSGSRVYSFGGNVRLPDSCWHQIELSVGQRHMTALRFTQVVDDLFGSGQTTRNSYVFDKEGLACAAQAMGESGRWNGYLGKNCKKTYHGSTSALPFLILYAE